jgi:hypothetical protein
LVFELNFIFHIAKKNTKEREMPGHTKKLTHTYRLPAPKQKEHIPKQSLL